MDMEEAEVTEEEATMEAGITEVFTVADITEATTAATITEAAITSPATMGVTKEAGEADGTAIRAIAMATAVTSPTTTPVTGTTITPTTTAPPTASRSSCRDTASVFAAILNVVAGFSGVGNPAATYYHCPFF